VIKKSRQGRGEIRKHTVSKGKFPPQLHENPRKYTQVFPAVFILPGRKFSLYKLLCTRKEEILFGNKARKRRHTGFVWRAFATMFPGKRFLFGRMVSCLAVPFGYVFL